MVDLQIEKWPAFSEAIIIHAPASKVWECITNPECVTQWMSDEGITFATDWKVGNSIIIKGTLHWVYFENTGTVLQFDREKVLKYSHLSSLSKLPDEPGSYTLFEFRLVPQEDQTRLIVTITNFPTESIYRHIVFYWNITLGILKKYIENK